MTAPTRKYEYKRKAAEEIRHIAAWILSKCPERRLGYAVDIEGIVEDLGFDIIFRPMAKIPVEAYVPANYKLIVVNELNLHILTRYRFTLSEELAHRILEYNLWVNGEIPDGGRVHELTRAQYKAIERDAKSLAAEILEPEDQFRERYAHHIHELELSGCKGGRTIRNAIREVAKDFWVSGISASYRAKNLGLISPATHAELFPPLF